MQQHVLACGWERVGRAEWQMLRDRFPETSESTVRGALAEMAIGVDQPFAGVGTKRLEDLELSLLSMAEAHTLARAECRAVVIAAKDRARFAAQNEKVAPEKRKVKAEMVEWMLVWLGDPAMFQTWAQIRKRSGLFQELLQVE